MNKIADFWEKRSKLYQNEIEGVMPKSFPRVLNHYLDQWMFQQIDGTSKGHILDVGCGYGRLAAPLLDKYKEVKVSGIDISITYVQLFNQLLSPRGHAYVGTFEKLPFKDQSFDEIYVVTALMYIVNTKDHVKVMKELFRVLKPDGRLVLIERSPLGYQWTTAFGLVDLIRGKKHHEIPAVSFNRHDMTNLVTLSGGKVESVSGVPLFTILFPVLMVLSLLSPAVGNILLRMVQPLDTLFQRITECSLYISYQVYKK